MTPRLRAEAALREGYSVMLGDTHHDAQREERYGEMLLRREADGLIFHYSPEQMQRQMQLELRIGSLLSAASRT